MPRTTTDLRALLRDALDDPHADFRAGQHDAIARLIDGGGRHLVVQRTGWGKSMVFFIATRVLRDRGSGPTLVISPLLSLMRDQVRAAERLGLRAARIDSANRDAWDDVMTAIERGAVDLLYVSPERLANESFLQRVLPVVQDRLELLVVDEAHCISDWGHDFRPDYRRIRLFIDQLPRAVRLLAVTATANDRVVDDLTQQLGPKLAISRGDLVRESLALQATIMPSALERYAWLADHLRDLPGSGIVYVLTIRDAYRLAEWLRSEDYRAAAYTGQSSRDDPGERERLEHALHTNELDVVVATSALGMGFDKPDLGYVVHFQRPQSVVHYYQQVGRAGRAIDAAYGILLGGAEDESIHRWFASNAFPDPRDVEQLLGALQAAGDAGLGTAALERIANVRRTRLERTTKFLACEVPPPLRKDGSTWKACPLPDGYQLPAERMAAVNAVRRGELAEMDAYLRTESCLMNFLQRALDDDPSRIEPCGRCAPCRGRDLVPRTIDPATADRARAFLREVFIEIEPRKRWPAGVPGLAERHWPTNLGAKAMQPGCALCHLTDPIHGPALTAWHMRGETLPDALLRAFTDMVREHLNQSAAAPTWITCVPSFNGNDTNPSTNTNPDTTPARSTGSTNPRPAQLARHLSAELGLPFVPGAITKTHATAPQSRMQNSYHQVDNLIDAFAVDIPVDHDDQPVLLVDDVFDSRWTLTITAAHLRASGSGSVTPIALAQSGVG